MTIFPFSFYFYLLLFGALCSALENKLIADRSMCILTKSTFSV